MSVRAAVADTVRDLIPQTTRRKITMTRLASRQATSGLRDLPSFLIIGTERGGTSSLYKYLGRHPEVAPSLRKETEYFNRYFDKGEGWYRAHFSLRARRQLIETLGGQLLAFEATPLYMLDPRVPARVAELTPDVKLVVLLRNPVARALSKWRHYRDLGLETLSFPQAIGAELERLDGELERMLTDPSYFSRPFFRFSYMEGGKYSEQIRRWFEYFDRDSFLFVKSEDFYRDTPKVYEDILRFLEVRLWQPDSFRMYSSATSRNPMAADQELDPALRARLEDHFRPFNEDLESLLARRFSWFDGA